MCIRDRVDIDGETVGSIGRGIVILLGIGHEDTEDQAERLWSKIGRLRIFEDESGKTNLSLADVGGEVLVVSQFTLFASCKRGNRPSFTDAGSPDDAKLLYEDVYKRQMSASGISHSRYSSTCCSRSTSAGP